MCNVVKVVKLPEINADLNSSIGRDTLAAVCELAEPCSRPAIYVRILGHDLHVIISARVRRVLSGLPSREITVKGRCGGAPNRSKAEDKIKIIEIMERFLI
jgi:hypothetical protein